MTPDPERVEVWLAMAEHFLDTETRHEIPSTALRCLDARLTTSAARDVWRYEVSPAVAFNVWSVAGEWGAWDREWLVREIENARSSRLNRPHLFGRLVYRARVHVMDRMWQAIAACMEALLAVPPGERPATTHAMTFLARHYFDFGTRDLAKETDDVRARIEALYPAPFRGIVSTVSEPDEIEAADRRVSIALGRSEPR